MRGMDVVRFVLAAGRSLGMIALLGLAIAVVLGPASLTEDLKVGAAGKGAHGDEQVVEAELMDFWTTEGFTELALAVAAIPDEPKWEAVRTVMEARGCTSLRYAFQLRWRQAGGGVDVITYIRRPYDEPWNSQEFLSLLKGDPKPTDLRVRIEDRPVELGPDDATTPDLVLLKLLRSRRPPL